MRTWLLALASCGSTPLPVSPPSFALADMSFEWHDNVAFSETLAMCPDGSWVASGGCACLDDAVLASLAVGNGWRCACLSGNTAHARALCVR